MAYIQLYEFTRVCQTFPTEKQYRVLVTPEEQYLKKSGVTDEFCVSQEINITILDNYFIDEPSINKILDHSNDEMLDAIIINDELKIIGLTVDDDEEILMCLPISTFIQSPGFTLRTPLSLYASKNYLTAHGHDFF